MQEKNLADIGDYLKIFAVMSVFIQSILGFTLAKNINQSSQVIIGIIYNLIKYSAPAFIFGILFTNTRQNLGPSFNLKKYYLKIFRAFILPFLLWSAFYLLIFPNLQQVKHFYSWQGFISQLVLGNAAPHLWYATMMLQFLIIMPVFNLIVIWIDQRPEQRLKKFIILLAVVIGIAVVWLIFYDTFIFHGPYMKSSYLFDRFFVSFLLYGCLGSLAAIFFEFYCDFLYKWNWLFGILAIISFILINLELFHYGFPIKLANAPYYKPSMVIYDLSIIFGVSYLAVKYGNLNLKLSLKIHSLAKIAYLAYLPNVVWSWTIWKIMFSLGWQPNIWLVIIIVYILTVFLSFLTAKIEAKIFLK